MDRIPTRQNGTKCAVVVVVVGDVIALAYVVGVYMVANVHEYIYVYVRIIYIVANVYTHEYIYVGRISCAVLMRPRDAGRMPLTHIV